MSGYNYVTNPDKLFEDDDDIDDETFLKNSRVTSPSQSTTNPFEEQRQAFEERKRQFEERTIQSSQRSLGLLRETEEVGIATAGELSKQREQLERSSRQLDDISSTLRFSQKHLNGLKSVFGGLKNYLSGNRDMPPPSSSTSGGKLSDSDDCSLSSPPPPPMSPDERYSSHPISRLRKDNDFSDGDQQQTGRVPDFQVELDQNLDEMTGSLSRLKNLALDLNQEITSQNDLLDNMGDKIEDVDIKIGKQNKQMHKLLKK